MNKLISSLALIVFTNVAYGQDLPKFHVLSTRQFRTQTNNLAISAINSPTTNSLPSLIADTPVTLSFSQNPRTTKLGDIVNPLPECAKTNLNQLCLEFSNYRFVGFIIADDCSVFLAYLDANLANHYKDMINLFGDEVGLTPETSELQGTWPTFSLDRQHMLFFRKMNLIWNNSKNLPK